jgi:hypothetical protein
MSENKIIYGTPSMILLPSAKYKFTVDKKVHRIIIPKKGFYKELDSDFFTEADGSFDILNDRGVFDVPAVSKVLYAMKKYPKLEANQLFAPLRFKVKEDAVEIFGQIIEVLQPNKEK